MPPKQSYKTPTLLMPDLGTLDLQPRSFPPCSHHMLISMIDNSVETMYCCLKRSQKFVPTTRITTPVDILNILNNDSSNIVSHAKPEKV